MMVSTFPTYARAALRRPFTVAAATFVMALMMVGVSATYAGASTPTAATTTSPDTAAEVVNINAASEKELTFLPGIGPSKASKIIAYRNKRPFKRITHLARVRGIGLKTVRKLKPYLTLKGETTLRKPLRLPRKAKR